MATEGQTETVVAQPGGASSTTDAGKPNADQPDGKKPADASGASPVKNEDYERRLTGITADLQKERKARQQFEKDLAAAKAEVESERKRVQALAGITPKSDVEAEEDAIRQRFAVLYPHLANLTQEDIEAIREQRQLAGTMQETQQLYWQRHNSEIVSNLKDNLEKEIGGKLTDRQMKRVIAEYVREAETNPEFLDRHEKGDKTLVAEFAKQLVEDWFEPARRKVTQQESQRYRAVPSGKDRGIVTQGEKKIDVTDSKAVEDFLVKGFRERNGDFTGRR